MIDIQLIQARKVRFLWVLQIKHKQHLMHFSLWLNHLYDRRKP